jgi:hypothetical protein
LTLRIQPLLRSIARTLCTTTEVPAVIAERHGDWELTDRLLLIAMQADPHSAQCHQQSALPRWIEIDALD